MPEICSRVCPQERLCEGSCILNARSEPISIGAIERFINEYAFAQDAVKAAPAPPNGFQVAVVGSGPGGMACADELAQRGYTGSERHVREAIHPWRSAQEPPPAGGPLQTGCSYAPAKS
jgi:glutamate synthase (NADPH/NADH) small chain